MASPEHILCDAHISLERFARMLLAPAPTPRNKVVRVTNLVVSGTPRIFRLLHARSEPGDFAPQIVVAALKEIRGWGWSSDTHREVRGDPPPYAGSSLPTLFDIERRCIPWSHLNFHEYYSAADGAVATLRAVLLCAARLEVLGRPTPPTEVWTNAIMPMV